MILGIIVFILKLIMWIILGILGLLLLLILMVLFVPITYRGMFSKCDSIRAKGRVGYLFGAVRVFFEYVDGDIRYKAKVLFFTVAKDGYDEPEEANREEEVVSEEVESDSGADVDDTTLEEPTKEEPIKKEESIKKEPVKEEPVKKLAEKAPQSEVKKTVSVEESRKPPDKGSVKTEGRQTEKTFEAEPKKKPASKSGKKAKRIKRADSSPEEESTWDKVKRFYGFLKAPENQGLFKFVMRMIGKALKSILPKKIEGRLNFGLDDPAITGYILAVVSSMYPLYGENLVITPDFEGPRIEGNVKFRGRIIIGVIAYYGVRIILDRRVRRLIREVRK